jgi:hypothetical protein
MKKVFFILSLFAATAATAQTYEPLPDGNFEEWKTGNTFNGDAYDELADTFWQTLNLLSTLPPEMSTGPVTVSKVTGKSGYAPMAKSDTLWVGTKRIFLPGVFGAFTLNITDKTAYFGRPFHSRPDSIVGYMKYTPVNNDSANIFVEVYKRIKQSGVDRKVTIGKADKIFHGAIDNWTRFSIPVEYSSDETPDSITVLFIASADIKGFKDLFGCGGQTGSTIWVDECRFVYNSQPQATEVKQRVSEAVVYPNPTDGDVFVKTASPVRKGKIEIYDNEGRIVKTQEFSGTNASLDLRSLKSSMYFYRVISGNEMLKSGRINLVK